MTSYPLQIKNAVSTGKFEEIKSPYDGAVVASVEKADGAALEQALSNAERSFHETMRPMPAHQRATILYRVAELMKERHEDLSMTIALEGAKPLKDARVEVTRAINTTKMSGDEALQLNGETLTMDRAAGTENHLAITVREPVGPVLAISAFNHPVNLICHQVCTAFAAGNSVVVKPASQTPISAIKMRNLFVEAGLPEEVISVATCSGSETNTLVSDERIRFIAFIGSADVGFGIQQRIPRGVHLTLELGGTGTAIVAEDADIEHMLGSVLRGAFYHAGQVCVSTQILRVHEDIYDDVVPELVARVKTLKTGAATDADTDVGPLIATKERDRVAAWVDEAKAAGAKVLCGGESLDFNCYAPTVLEDPPRDTQVITKEIFGPVVCVMKYNNLDEVIDEINATPYGFQSAIYTQDIDRAISTARRIDVKACMINDTTAFRVDWMPFGGKKHSGLGTGGIRTSIYEMTDEKLIVINVRG